MGISPLTYTPWSGTRMGRLKNVLRIVFEEAKIRVTVWSLIIILITYLLVYINAFYQAVRPAPIEKYGYVSTIGNLYLYMMLLSAYLAFNIISRDLKNGSIILYLSRPITRIEYIVSKFLAVCFHLSLITIVPLLLVYIIDIASLPQSSKFITEASKLLLPLIGSALLMVILFGSVTIMLSSLTKDGKWASAGVFGVFLIGGFIAEIVGSALNNNYAYLFYLWNSVIIVVINMFGMRISPRSPPWYHLPWYYGLSIIIGAIVLSFSVVYWRFLRREGIVA